MTKGERISRFVAALEPASPQAGSEDVVNHPCYRGFFRCWNEQRYYEAHDVLEHLWLQTKTEDAQYFKGLIQAAGAFVHLQKHYEHPTHPKHGRRLAPARRLFALAGRNLEPFAPMRYGFDVAQFLDLLKKCSGEIGLAGEEKNPWSPANAPTLQLDHKTGNRRGTDRNGKDDTRGHLN